MQDQLFESVQNFAKYLISREEIFWKRLPHDEMIAYLNANSAKYVQEISLVNDLAISLNAITATGVTGNALKDANLRYVNENNLGGYGIVLVGTVFQSAEGYVPPENIINLANP